MLMHTSTLYLTTVLIWGSTFFAIKLQLGEVPAEVSVAYRFALAALILLAWCAWRKLPMRFGVRQHLWMLAQGLTLFGLNYMVVYWATAELTSGLIAVVFSTIVLMNIANAAVFFRRRPALTVLAGAVIGLIGIGLVFLPELAKLKVDGAALKGLLLSLLGTYIASLGNMWIFMLLLEIPLIGWAGATLRRLGSRGVLLMGLLAETIRWTTCALTTDLDLVRAVQLLHGVGVAGIIIGAPLYLERAVPERLRATGQALVSTAGYGAGAIVSNSVGGWLFDHAGPHAPYALAGGGLALLSLLLYRWLPEPHRPLDDPGSAEPVP